MSYVNDPRREYVNDPMQSVAFTLVRIEDLLERIVELLEEESEGEEERGTLTARVSK